ncbi:transcriptional regulatory protein [Rutstroemia sp. NJR-2017a BBW]|nr:transcriptional regulatory protein [Rutstroemia sp. NJR-2017a BBW]
MNHPRPETDQSQTVRKRRRTQLACNTCRDRKTRCNGERPACSSCTRRGVRDSCSYEEVTVGSHRSAVSPGASNGNTIATPGFVASGSPSPSTKDRPPSPTLHISNASPAGKVDALAMVADSTTGDSLYGRSSTIALVSQVREAASIPAAQRSPASGSQNSLEILHKQDFYNFILPQRQHADAFLACYWEFAHPVFPILHMPSFNSSYDQLWVSRTEADKHSDELDDTIFHATLNLVFALGCQYSIIAGSAVPLDRCILTVHGVCAPVLECDWASHPDSTRTGFAHGKFLTQI